MVLDDPASILRCTNKVFLSDLLAQHGLGMRVPRSSIANDPRNWKRWGGAWAIRWC